MTPKLWEIYIREGETDQPIPRREVVGMVWAMTAKGACEGFAYGNTSSHNPKAFEAVEVYIPFFDHDEEAVMRLAYEQGQTVFKSSAVIWDRVG